MDYQSTIKVRFGEDGFKDTLSRLIKFTRIDPESAPALADEVYREEFGLPMDAVYAQFLD